MSKYDEFIAQIAEPAQRICVAKGLPASVCIAQAILESAWGESVIGNANYWGRKWGGWGKYVETETQECYDGAWQTITAKFQDYDSVDQAVADWCTLMLEQSEYAPAAVMLPDVAKFIDAMAAVYATNPGYAHDIHVAISANNLTQYDEA